RGQANRQETPGPENSTPGLSLRGFQRVYACNQSIPLLLSGETRFALVTFSARGSRIALVARISLRSRFTLGARLSNNCMSVSNALLDFVQVLSTDSRLRIINPSSLGIRH